jgi:hypothetical protein
VKGNSLGLLYDAIPAIALRLRKTGTHFSLDSQSLGRDSNLGIPVDDAGLLNTRGRISTIRNEHPINAEVK